MNIGDLFWSLRADDARLQADVRTAGAKAGKTLGQQLSESVKKAWSGEQLGKGLVQGLGLAGGLAAANVVKNTIGGIKDAFTGTIGAAVEFERGMLNVQSITKGTDLQLAEMGETVLDLSGQFGQSAATMSAALYDISSSGFQGAEAIEVLEAASMAATAGLATTAEAASGITAVLNAYGLAAEDAAGVSDVLFQTVNRGVVTFPELSANIGKTTALAAPLGVSLEEVGAALAVMTRAGIDAENATTQLNAIMAAILKPSKEAADLAADLGIDWSVAGLKANGLAKTLTAMLKATKGNEDQMATLLGDARAIRGAFSLAARSGAEFNEELEIMNEAAGETAAAFGVQSRGAGFQIAQMEAEMAAAGIRMARDFLPALLEIVRFMRDVAVPGVVALVDGIKLLGEGIGVFADIASAITGLGPSVEKGIGTIDRAALNAAASMEHMADASKDDLLVVREEYGMTAEEARAASQVIERANSDILASINALRDAVIGKGQEVADALYDPIIVAGELADTQAELRVIKAEIAAGNLTDVELKELDRRRAEVGKRLIELTNQYINSGTQIEQINKISAFLSSNFWTQAYEGATAEQKLILDDWRTSLETKLSDMVNTAEEKGGQVRDGYTGEIRSGADGVEDATRTLLGGSTGPMSRNIETMRGYGRSGGTAFAQGLESQTHRVEQAASKLAGAAGSYLKVSSPAERGPWSQAGGPEGWGAHFTSLLADGVRSRIADIVGAARAVSGAGSANLAFAAAGPSLGARISVPGSGMSLPAIGPSASDATVTAGNTYHYHIHAEGQLKVPNVRAAATELQRFGEIGALPGAKADD